MNGLGEHKTTSFLKEVRYQEAISCGPHHVMDIEVKNLDCQVLKTWAQKVQTDGKREREEKIIQQGTSVKLNKTVRVVKDG